MLGVGLAFLTELLDKTVKDERFIVEALELPILGQVSEISKKSYTKIDQKNLWLKKIPKKNEEHEQCLLVIENVCKGECQMAKRDKQLHRLI